MVSDTPCPCGHPLHYSACCGRWHAGEAAPDAEALMRSRYSAYVLNLAEYLQQTWLPETRPERIELDPPGTRRWLGLRVCAYQRIDEDHAEVEFVARSKLGGASAQRLHERSRFVRVNGRWYYRDGEMLG